MRDGTEFPVAGQLMGGGEHFDDDPIRSLKKIEFVRKTKTPYLGLTC